jgi:ABC-2 type transport system permease protein
MRAWDSFRHSDQASPSGAAAVSYQRKLDSYLAMARKELLILTRYPVEFVTAFGRIFLIVAIFALAGRMFYAGGSTEPKASGGAVSNPAGIVVYGFVLFMFMSDTLWTVGYSIHQEQLQGTLEQLYLAPASKFASLLARVTNTLVWNGVLTVAASALMVAMIGRLPVENPLLGAYLLLMSLAGTFGMGFAFAALSLRLKETAQTAANFLQFALLILCANFFPFSVLPPVVLAISRWIPLAYCVDAFRSVMMGFPAGFPELASIEVEMVIVTLFGVGMPFVGYLLYHWAERQARQEGSLSTY